MAEQKKIDPNAWMYSFSDMVTLMLTFFVLLLAMANVDTVKLRKALSNFPGSVSSLYEGAGRGASIGPYIYSGPEAGDVRVGSDEVKRDIQRILELAQWGRSSFFEGVLEESSVQVYTDRRGIVLSFLDDILFKKGDATLLPGAMEVVRAFAEMIKKYDFNVVVEGHSGPDLLKGDEFESNWELSVVRAGVVVQRLINTGHVKEDRIAIAGYGDLKPLFPNDTEEHKRRNQRVEMVLYKKNGESIWELGQW